MKSEASGPSHPEREDRLDPGKAREPLAETSARPAAPEGVELREAEELRPAKEQRPARDRGRGRAGVVVGIDGSDAARAALRWAAEFASYTRSAVSAVAVWQQPPQFGDVPGPTTENLEREAVEWLRHALSDLPQAEVSTTVDHGDPSQILLDKAADVDLLVLGNHGRGALSGALLGSVAHRCARHARCPVVLVPPPDLPT